jgi:tRNA pseudouridine55 synthase
MESKFLLINKPKDWTSHDVVAVVRKKIREESKGKVGLPAEARRAKVGHAGTLDPFATGLLIVGVGRESTKRLDEFKNMPKTYIATVKLGATSTTFDPEGEITITKHEPHSTKQKDIETMLQSFIGKQLQIPPMYSAKKVGGKKLYDLARKGIEIERQPNKIEIYSIKLLDYNYPSLKIEVNCSTGTYIRTLAHDIGEKLGCGAYCEELERTSIGEYKLEDAEELKK